MKKELMIPVREFCIYHQVDESFIQSLKESGLIEVNTVEERTCIPENQLPQLEKLVWMYEMDINLEGIETITHLLEQMNALQEKLKSLQNRLGIYESE